MPYFKSKKSNLLFIHIPKTGGTSLEIYFSKKYNIPLGVSSLFGTIPISWKHKLNLQACSMQHLVLSKIVKHKSTFNVQLSPSTTMLSIVRNPYTRIISDLFYFKLITPSATKDLVFRQLQKYLRNYRVFDNHPIPQNAFLINDKGVIPKNMIVMHTETLTEDMRKHGFTDFNVIANINSFKTKHNTIDYFDYLNSDSIKVINRIYANDFKIFAYPMILEKEEGEGERENTVQ
jgi:hypothetical protein